MAESIVENIDCMEGMKRYVDKYFSLAIVDPPYGIGFGKFNRTNKTESGERYKANKYKNGDWDSAVPDSPYFLELQRVSKHQIIWGGNYYFDELGNSKGLICWYKHQPVDNFSDCEYAWISLDKPARVFDYPYYGNLEGHTKAAEKIHPTQKPVALYKWLLKNYATQGDKILDTHLGSGSSRIAAYDLGFSFTAFEIDADYFAAQEKRFQQHISQLTLFTNGRTTENTPASLQETHQDFQAEADRAEE
jgi:site-specific DNA-methyltransferase (adenine-specific)